MHLKNPDILASNQRKRKNLKQPVFVKDFSDYGDIQLIHFSKFQWTTNILLVAFENRILLAVISFEETINVEKIFDFTHATRCTALTLSPDTSLDVLPNRLIFACGGADYKIRIFKSDAKDHTIKTLTGHSSYINSLTYGVDNRYLASASDDNSVKVWNVEDYQVKCTFSCTSPAVVVSWHRSDPKKLLVAEKIGLVKFYNVENETLILSFDFGKSISAAHWASSDCHVLATLQLGELLIWDLTKPCFPQQSAMLFNENGGDIQFSPFGELVASVNSVDGHLKVIHTTTLSLKLNTTIRLPSNVQWHCHYPIICIGSDTKLCFYKIGGI